MNNLIRDICIGNGLAAENTVQDDSCRVTQVNVRAAYKFLQEKKN